MIKRSYIHEYAPHDQFMCESYYLLLDTKDILNDLVRMENTIEEKKYFGESVENEIFVLEAEKKNIFERIGEAIINIFNSFIDFLKETGKSIKDSITGARKNTTPDKFKTAMQNDPSLAEEFLKGVMSGNIKAHDVKDLNSLMEEATKITNNLVDGKIDKKTFGEKIDSLLEKYGSMARNIASILGLATAGITIANGVNSLRDRRENTDDKRRKRVNDELNFANNLRRYQDDAGTDEAQKMHNRYYGKESSEELTSGEYFSEATSFQDVWKKVMNFFTESIDFCNEAVKKMSSFKDSLVEKIKKSKDSEEGSIINTAISGLNKVMAFITKELTTIRNAASKAKTQTE